MELDDSTKYRTQKLGSTGKTRRTWSRKYETRIAHVRNLLTQLFKSPDEALIQIALTPMKKMWGLLFNQSTFCERLRTTLNKSLRKSSRDPTTTERIFIASKRVGIGYSKTRRFLTATTKQWDASEEKNVPLRWECNGLTLAYPEYRTSKFSATVLERFGPGSHFLVPELKILRNEQGTIVGVALPFYSVVRFAAAIAVLPQNKRFLRKILDGTLGEAHIAMVYGESADAAPQDKQKNFFEHTVSIRTLLGFANSPLNQFHFILGNIDDKDLGFLRELLIEKEQDEVRLAEESAGDGVPVPLLAEQRTDDGRYQECRVHFRNGFGVPHYAGTGQHDGRVRAVSRMPQRVDGRSRLLAAKRQSPRPRILRERHCQGENARTLPLLRTRD